MLKTSFLTLFLFLTGGCSWNSAGSTGCQFLPPPRPLPEALKESSGIAWSRTRPDILWSHNDGGEAVLFALDLEGNLVARMPFVGARMWDWEDLSVGDCPSGTCLYLADTGDNQEVRSQARLIRIPLPATLEEAPRTAEVFPFVLPNGPRDIEAIFVLPGEEVHFISKGRNDPVTVFRYPLPLRAGEVVVLEEIQFLSDGSMPIPSQVTGADASPDGRLVVVRSYEALRFYQVDAGHLIPVEGGRVALGTLQEPQGEAVGFGPDGKLLLTTEGGNFGGVASLRVLQCGESQSGWEASGDRVQGFTGLDARSDGS
jgi:hypothetical protein